MSTPRGWIVAHTHWDREWYRPFQVFRIRLVEMLDELIETMERDPRYRYFHLDGQTVVIDDYLQIRPEMRERLEALLRSGRMLAGPWFVQPDEALPSGEALIRNLLLGTRTADRLGGALRSGYLVDIFGHISQMPQILQGFGIDNAILFRGINDEEVPAEAWWEGSDGTRVLLLRLPNDVAYSDFFYYVRNPLGEGPLDLGAALGKVAELVAFERSRSTTPELLFLDGVDHIEILPELPDLIDRWNAERGDEATLIQASLPEYLTAVRASLGELQVLRGELRSPSKAGRLSNLFYGFHSSRVWIKQRNDRCESLLALGVEPWTALLGALGGEYPRGLVDHAWRQLLENHPHDSICGCSIDQVHRDMAYRFDQCEILGEELLRRTLGRLAESLPTGAEGEEGLALTLWNASGAPFAGAFEVTADFAHPWPESFRLLDAEGAEVPFQVLEWTAGIPGLDVRRRGIPFGTCTDRVRLALSFALPRVGACALRVEPLEAPPAPSAPSLVAGPTVLDNGLVRLEAREDGTFDLTDHALGQTWTGLLRLEDNGDTGDGWTYRWPPEDLVIDSRSGEIGPVEIVHAGPLQATLQRTLTMRVPAGIAAGHARRSEELVDLPITLQATLSAGCREVRFRVGVDNTASDHRLRACFPSGLASETQWQDMAFDLVERPIALRDTTGWLEQAQEILPQQSLCAITDGRIGLSVVAPGLKESCVRDDPERTIALTLLRAFGSTVGTVGEPEAQIPGRHSFEMAVVAFAGAVEGADLLSLAQRMRSPVRAVVTSRHRGDLSNPFSLLAVEPPSLPVTTLKRAEGPHRAGLGAPASPPAAAPEGPDALRAEDPRPAGRAAGGGAGAPTFGSSGDGPGRAEDGEALVVRIANPTSEAVAATVRVGLPLTGAWRARLDETREEELVIGGEGYEVALDLGPRQIATLLLEPRVRHGG